MAKLVFRVQSDWEEVVRLRNEIAKLKQELMSMDGTQSPAAFKALNVQLAASNQRLDELVTNAAKAGAEMETGFKRKIFDASQVVNELSEKITFQRGTIQQLKNELSGLKDKYREALKQDGDTSSLEVKIRSTNEKLKEQKSSLFNLTQEQANARLSVKKLRDEYALYNNDGKKVVETNEGIAISWKKALAVIGGAATLKQLGSEMIRVRGEFQSMQTAIETMVGKDMAGRLIPQIKELAKISPLTMSDMVGAEKMMLGFNIQAEDTIKYLKAISDISMGESGKFNSLTLAFSQMSATGRLLGGDLNQMINAGFNPLRIISEKTGKSIATLKDEMSKGAVSAEMVQQAFIDATSAGGKFYQMSENASKTINGQISMMQDAWDNALNEIGKSSEGFIMSGIQATTSLIQNYETVGKILVGMIATYGVYKTALITNITLTRGWAVAARTDAVAKGIQTIATKAQTVAQLALNSAMRANPYVLAATLIMGATSAMWAFRDSTTATERAIRRHREEQEKFQESIKQRKNQINELIRIIQDETETEYAQINAYEELQKLSPILTDAYSREELATLALAKSQKLLNEERDKQNYDNIIVNVKKYTDIIAKSRAEAKKLRDAAKNEEAPEKAANLNFLASGHEMAANKAERDLTEWKRDLDEYNRLKKQAEEDAKPVEVKLMEAESNHEQIKQEFLAAKMALEQAQEELKKSPFATIPIGIQLRFNQAQNAFNKSSETISGLKDSQQDSEKTYKEAYEEAEENWKAKTKAVQDAKNKSKAEYMKAVKELEEAEKAYRSLGGVTGSALTKQENQAEKLRKQTDRYNALLNKQALEQQRSAEDLQMKVDEARIKAMDEGSAKTIAEMELNFEKEMQAIDRQKEDAFRKKVEDARAAWEANPKNKGKSFDATDIKLSDDEQNYYDELYKIAIISNEKIYKDLAEHYLSYADERLAIEKKFNDDISILQEARKKAEAKGDASEIAQIDRSIEKRTEIKNEDIFKLDAEQFKKNMNWEQVFGNLDKVSTDTLKKLKTNLKDFISSQKDLSPENLKELVDAIERIDDKVSERNSFEAMSVSFKSLKDATDAQREAQEAYNKALKEGTNEEKKNAKATLESAKNSRQKALFDATDALHKGVDEIGQYVDAGNQVIGIMETLGMKTPEWLEGTMSGFGEMLNGLGNIDLMKPMSIVTGSLQAIKGALTSITSLGGVINWNGSNAKEVQDSINRLTDRNEALRTSIEDLTDVMEASKGTKSVAAYTDAKKLQEETEENYKKIAQEQARYSNSHHSWNYYWGGFNQDEIARLSSQIGRNWNGDIWSLSPEEMKMLRSNVDMWEKIQNTGKGNYGGRLTEKLNDYIDQAGKMEELTNKLYEGLTGISFESMYDSFIDTLMDMDASAEDAADNIADYFMRAMLSNKIGELYSEKLKAWWEKFGKSMEDNELTESEREALQNEYMQYVEEAMKIRDEIAAATGYTGSSSSSSQEASKKGFATASQDSIDELNGRFTALQIAGEEIKNQSVAQSQSLNILTMKADALISINTETRNIADDTRDLIASSYLELVQISENTGAIIKPIQQMQKDIAEVKNNTKGLSTK